MLASVYSRSALVSLLGGEIGVAPSYAAPANHKGLAGVGKSSEPVVRPTGTLAHPRCKSWAWFDKAKIEDVG
jgi:hypothetical protein